MITFHVALMKEIYSQIYQEYIKDTFPSYSCGSSPNCCMEQLCVSQYDDSPVHKAYRLKYVEELPVTHSVEYPNKKILHIRLHYRQNQHRVWFFWKFIYFTKEHEFNPHPLPPPHPGWSGSSAVRSSPLCLPQRAANLSGCSFSGTFWWDIWGTFGTKEKKLSEIPWNHINIQSVQMSHILHPLPFSEFAFLPGTTMKSGLACL